MRQLFLALAPVGVPFCAPPAVEVPPLADPNPMCPYMTPVTDVTIEPLFFGTGKSAIHDWKWLTTVDAIAKTLDEHSDWMVTITAQTNSNGDFNSNQKLAHARADGVVSELKSRGVSSGDMLVLLNPESGNGPEARSVLFQFCKWTKTEDDW